jgi:tetratricopeptide (TPR) repeat protein
LYLDPSKGVEHFQDLLERARKGADQTLLIASASSLALSLARTDPLQAQRLIRLAMDVNSKDPLGPWVAAQLKTTCAEILYQIGSWQEALDMAEEVLAELDRLEDMRVEASGVNSWSLRRSAWETAAQAAHRLGRPAEAAAYQAKIHNLDSTAADRSAAETQFNDVYALIDSGQLDLAEQLLQAALGTFTGPSSVRERGLALISLAMVEHRRQNPRDAIEFARRALQTAYAARETLDAASAHAYMANFLSAAPPELAAEAPVHLLAAAVIHMRVSGGLIAIGMPQPPAISSFIKVALCQARQPTLLPTSFASLQQQLDESTGIDIGELLSGLERIPVRAGPDPGDLRFSFNDPSDLAGDSVTDVLCWARQQLPPESLNDRSAWQHFIDTTAAAARRDPGSQEALRRLMDDLRGTGWTALADALTCLATNPHHFVPPSDLLPTERKVVQGALETLANTTHSDHGNNEESP